MPLRRIDDGKDCYKPPCRNPEHNPPSHIVLPSGTYEHTCPGCGEKIVFTVTQPTM